MMTSGTSGVGGVFSGAPPVKNGGGVRSPRKGSATPLDRATNGGQAEANATNRHPVDQLADIRAEIKSLQEREATLRAKLLTEGADLSGGEFYARIVTSSQKRLDRKRLEEKFGADRIADCLVDVPVTSIKTIRREIDDAA